MDPSTTSGTTIKEQDLPAHRPVYIFGKDVMEITCFRSSFIFGICSGAVGGLGAFLFTSKALTSCHVAFASLWIGVFAYWIPCRYNYENSELIISKIRQQQELHKFVPVKPAD